VASLNAQVIAHQVKAKMRLLKFDPVVIWTRVPHAVLTLECLPSRRVVYDCTDDYSQFNGSNATEVERLESALLDRANTVFVTSETLLPARSIKNENTHWISNGVDFDLFSRAASSDLTTVPEMEGLPRPRLLHLGYLADWVDIDLVAKLAETVEGSIVQVGPAKPEHIERLRSYENFHWLGMAKDRNDLPKFIKGADVCIAPFRQNNLTAGVNPLKVYDYMAAGKPVVATALPSLQRFRDVIRLAENTDDFVSSVKSALSEPDLLVQDRIDRASQFAWDKIFEKMTAELFKLD
jgi:glycosyltransferase involved in cell wall biosynthesis